MADADFAGDLPEEMEGELEEEDAPEALKQKLAELDAEAEKLKEDATKMEEELKGGGANTSGSKEEADSRSVYVGNVRISQQMACVLVWDQHWFAERARCANGLTRGGVDEEKEGSLSCPSTCTRVCV